MQGANRVPPERVNSTGKLTTTLEHCIDNTIKIVGNQVVLALPLGLGKAHYIANAFYERAKKDSSISLHIITALTLDIPDTSADLSRRFLKPILDAQYKDYPELLYAQARRHNNLPGNIKVSEFFLNPGELLGNPSAQYHYLSSNYTHAIRDLLNHGVNVLAQMIAVHPERNDLFSLSCNTDVTLALVDAAEKRGHRIVRLGEVNQRLPYMINDAVVNADYFDTIYDANEYVATESSENGLETLIAPEPEPANKPAKNTDDAVKTDRPSSSRPGSYALFFIPQAPVELAEFALGLHVASLVKDGGTLQIGIGALGDAVAHGLTLRQQHNTLFRRLLSELLSAEKMSPRESISLEMAPFTEGLYGCSEMLVEGLVHLRNVDILKRCVYHDEVLQQLLNDKVISEEVTPATLKALHNAGRISNRMTELDCDFLRTFGIFSEEVRYEEGALLLPSGKKVKATLSDTESLAAICAEALGERLINGIYCHAGFYVGSRSFYEQLRALKSDHMRGLNMTSVTFINHLYVSSQGSSPARPHSSLSDSSRNIVQAPQNSAKENLAATEGLKRAQRKDARFVNTAMMVTLTGAVISDGLDTQQVVSGIGGQYNFVAQAQELEGGRSIICVPSTRTNHGEVTSNVVWEYGYTSVPRHLRDIVVTEYGVADLRGKSDRDVIVNMLAVADSRFQPALLQQAKNAKKIEADYQIPSCFTHNNPEMIACLFEQNDCLGHFPYYPLGRDFTNTEAVLAVGLKYLKQHTKKWQLLRIFLAGWRHRYRIANDYSEHLMRLDLSKPKNLKEYITRLMVTGALSVAFDPKRFTSKEKIPEPYRDETP